MNYTAETYNNINLALFYGGGFCGGVDPRREQYAGEDVAGVEVPDYKTKYEALQNVIKDNYQLFEVDYYGIDNDNYVDGAGFCCEPQANTRKGRSLPTENVDYEKLQYYYHSDHLGSASYITNLDGEVVQHIEYVPFGEVFLEERNNTWNTPFLFNGKELDEETGLYYYGARYYNPTISLWLSTDPLQEKYPHISTYAYTFNNPIRYIDPTGMEGDEPPTSQDIYQSALKLLPPKVRGGVEELVNQMQEQIENFDFSKVGIGMENTIGFSASAGVKSEAKGIVGNVMFLGGEDAGYVYTYYGGEVGFGGESSIVTSGNLETRFFVAYNHSGEGGHKSFDGKYTYLSGSLGASTGTITSGVDVSLSGSLSVAWGKNWLMYSGGASVGVGAGISTVITVGAMGGEGNVSFYNRESVGANKTLVQKLISQYKWLSPVN